MKYPQHQFNPKVKNSQSLALSPIDTEGSCHFLAFDVDSGRPEDVKTVLTSLPEGCVPLVSFSGKKGWHVWLFSSEPVPIKAAVGFVKAVREKAGISCEVFPTGRNSKCLKWPGFIHPETGKQEVFVPPDNLEDVERLDTPLILEYLAEGMWRTPVEVIGENISDNQRTLQKNGNDCKLPQNNTLQHPTALITGKTLPDNTNLAAIPEIALGLAGLYGRRVSRIGQAFKCILPGHQERRPSAAFCYGNNGTIVYHDFHHEKHGTPEILTLGEAYAAAATGRIEKLRSVDAARWLCKLALRLGFRTQTAATFSQKLKTLSLVLHSLGLILQPTGNIYSPVGCKTRGPVGFKANKIKVSGDLVIEKVWRVFCEEAVLSAMAGFTEVKLSKRFLAGQAGIPADMANRAVNLLAVLGVVEKVPGSGRMKGDRFTLGDVGVEEARRRLNALFPKGKVDLRTFKRELVVKRLGEETAAKVFRRGCETPSKPFRNPSQTVTETVTRTVPLTVPEKLKNPFIPLIAEAEKDGDEVRIKILLRGFQNWVKAGKPEIQNVEDWLVKQEVASFG